MIVKGKSLSWLDTTTDDPIDLAYNHRMDISGSVFSRMNELGMTQSDLAAKTGMDRSQISRIITGKQNITLSTLAKLEVALSFRLDEGFTHVTPSAGQTFTTKVPEPPVSASGWNPEADSPTRTLPASYKGFTVFEGVAA